MRELMGLKVQIKPKHGTIIMLSMVGHGALALIKEIDVADTAAWGDGILLVMAIFRHIPIHL